MPTDDATADDSVGTAGSQDLVDKLALLHAGALAEPERAQVRAAAANDPTSQAILVGLDMVCAQLRKLDQVLPPNEPMPELVARRLDRELAKLGGEVAGVLGETGGRKRWATAASVGSVAAAAAVLSLVTYAAWPRGGQNSSDPAPQAKQAAPSAASSNGPQVVDNRFRIERDELGSLSRAKPDFADLGPLADANVRSGCLAANGFAGLTPVAAGRIVRDGKVGIFMMIPTPSTSGSVMTVLVVGTECKAGVPDLLSKQVFGKN